MLPAAPSALDHCFWKAQVSVVWVWVKSGEIIDFPSITSQGTGDKMLGSPQPETQTTREGRRSVCRGTPRSCQKLGCSHGSAKGDLTAHCSLGNLDSEAWQKGRFWIPKGSLFYFLLWYWDLWNKHLSDAALHDISSWKVVVYVKPPYGKHNNVGFFCQIQGTFQMNSHKI